jgi:hypothetical protein
MRAVATEDEAMSKLLLTVRREPSGASLDAVRQDLGLSEEEIDSDFGVVLIDPEKNLYAIMVEESASARIEKEPDVEGPFANPPIEPFGPPQPPE